MPENTTSLVRRDPNRPFVIDTRELGRRPGASRIARRDVPVPADFRVDLVGVPEGASLELDLRFESVVEGVYVSGTVTGPLTGECRRCLEPITSEVEADVAELFAYPDSTTTETTEEDEVRRVEADDTLDLEAAVRDAVVLALPLEPLCRSDCAGLCATCGERLADLPADHMHETTDPRWAALAERFAVQSDGGAEPESAVPEKEEN